MWQLKNMARFPYMKSWNYKVKPLGFEVCTVLYLSNQISQWQISQNWTAPPSASTIMRVSILNSVWPLQIISAAKCIWLFCVQARVLSRSRLCHRSARAARDLPYGQHLGYEVIQSMSGGGMSYGMRFRAGGCISRSDIQNFQDLSCNVFICDCVSSLHSVNRFLVHETFNSAWLLVAHCLVKKFNIRGRKPWTLTLVKSKLRLHHC